MKCQKCDRWKIQYAFFYQTVCRKCSIKMPEWETNKLKPIYEEREFMNLDFKLFKSRQKSRGLKRYGKIKKGKISKFQSY